MVRFGFRNFCFWNRFVSKMIGVAYGLSREIVCWMFCVVFTKTGLSGQSPEYFRGQAWPDLWPRMTNVCYCHKLNNMLNM